MKIIGIDPGVNTGVALFIGGKLNRLETIGPYRLVAFLTYQQPYGIVIEDSRLTTNVWTANKTDSKGKKPTIKAGLKIARNVGMVDCICHIVEAYAKSTTIEIIQQSPADKGTKVDARYFCDATGWNGLSKQHERDAAMAAYPFRNFGMRK